MLKKAKNQTSKFKNKKTVMGQKGAVRGRTENGTTESSDYYSESELEGTSSNSIMKESAIIEVSEPS